LPTLITSRSGAGGGNPQPAAAAQLQQLPPSHPTKRRRLSGRPRPRAPLGFAHSRPPAYQSASERSSLADPSTLDPGKGGPDPETTGKAAPVRSLADPRCGLRLGWARVATEGPAFRGSAELHSPLLLIPGGCKGEARPPGMRRPGLGSWAAPNPCPRRRLQRRPGRLVELWFEQTAGH